jgi:hypothetical protein
MSLPTSLIRRARIAGIGTAALLSLLALQAAPGRQPQSQQSSALQSHGLAGSLVLPMRYAGIGNEGVDLIWRGTITAPLAGQATVRMAYAGPPEDHGMPIWPVTALVFFSADDYRSSFIAELSGTMDWTRGEMLGVGLVTDGAAANTRLEHVFRIRDAEWNGSLTFRFLPRAEESVAVVTVKD